MWSYLSCCCAKTPCEQQDEEQRLIGEVQSPQTSLKVSEGGPVNPDCVTTESSASPSPTTEHNDQSNASLVLEATPPGDVAPKAASAQDGSILLDHEKVASELVSEVLAGSTKIVASESFAKLAGEGDVATSSAPQTQAASPVQDQTWSESGPVSGGGTAGHTASSATDNLTLATGIEDRVSQTVVETKTVENADGQTSSSPSNGPVSSDTCQAASAEKPSLDPQSSEHAKVDKGCDSTKTETGVKEAAVCHVKAEGQHMSAGANEVRPLASSPRKDTPAVVHLNGSLEGSGACRTAESDPALVVNKTTEEASSAIAKATEDLTITSTEPVSIEKQATPTESKVDGQATSTPVKSPTASAGTVISTEQLDSQAMCNIAESPALPGENLEKLETEGEVAEFCHAKVEGLNVSEVPNQEATPLVASPKKESPSELHLNETLTTSCPTVDIVTEEASSTMASTTEDISVTSLEPAAKEKCTNQSNDMAIHGEDISIKPDSGELPPPPQDGFSTPGEDQVANEDPKSSSSPVSGGDDQVGRADQETLPDGSTTPHQEQDAPQPHPEIDLDLDLDHDLSSATSEGSPSAKASKNCTARPANESDLKQESCKGGELESSTLLLITSENAAPTETGGSLVESSLEDGLMATDTVCSPGDLLDGQNSGKLMTSKLDMELKSGITDEGPVEGFGDEKTEWDELDGNETWAACDDGDLYRGEDEIEEELEKELVKKLKLEERCSLEPPVDIMTYSEREWKGQTAKSAVIRKGYAALSQNFSFLQRVRGDNYCALRATMYQALMNPSSPPDWLQQDSFLRIPEQLESSHGLIEGWVFPDLCMPITGRGNAVDLMKHYLGLLQKWWLEAASAPGGWEGRRGVCERLFQGGEEEFGLMEALKLLMLDRAVELHAAMQHGDEVPIFCWLLFARDTSPCPRTFLANHLSQVGFSGGMEQVEMFLLGYALQHTIKAFRLYMADTEEFITHYPDDHIPEWPCVCLVTEDDRHYNVAVGEPTGPPQEDMGD